MDGSEDLSDDEDFLLRCEDGIFASNDEDSTHSLRMNERQKCENLVDAALRAGEPTGQSVLHLRKGGNLRWRPIPGNQQGVAWECSLRLCRVLEERLTSSCRTVLELGCGLGLPGLAAALLGAERVLLTDSSSVALEPAAAAVALNGLDGVVAVRPLKWGAESAAQAEAALEWFSAPLEPHARQGVRCDDATAVSPGTGDLQPDAHDKGRTTSEAHIPRVGEVSNHLEGGGGSGGGGSGEPGPSSRPDLVLCSDLIYGDEAPSRALVQTLLQVCGPDTVVLSLHERRLHGDQGASFFAALEEVGCFRVHKDLPFPLFSSSPSPPPPPSSSTSASSSSAPPQRPQSATTKPGSPFSLPEAQQADLPNLANQTVPSNENVEEMFFCLSEIRRIS